MRARMRGFVRRSEHSEGSRRIGGIFLEVQAWGFLEGWPFSTDFGGYLETDRGIHYIFRYPVRLVVWFCGFGVEPLILVEG